MRNAYGVVISKIVTRHNSVTDKPFTLNVEFFYAGPGKTTSHDYQAARMTKQCAESLVAKLSKRSERAVVAELGIDHSDEALPNTLEQLGERNSLQVLEHALKDALREHSVEEVTAICSKISGEKV
jgi:hypothetical protein